MTQAVFEPIKINNTLLQNRFVMSAAGSGCSGNLQGKISDIEKERLIYLSHGRIGLIITGGTAVHPLGIFDVNQMGIYSDEHIFPLKKMVKEIHQNNVKIALQLAHSGAHSGKSLEKLGKKAIAPSLSEKSYSYRKPFVSKNFNEATVEEIKEIIHSFGDGARRAREAGFDAVEIHAAHDSLLSQFLSPDTNQRKDEYGGSLENRMRLHQEIIKEIRKKSGNDFLLIIKLGIADGFQGGLSSNEGKKVAIELAKLGLDIIDVSQGLNGLNWEETCLRQNISTPQREGYFLHWCREIKQSITIPTILTGGLRSYEFIEKVIKDKETDLVGLCRPFIREPHLILDWEKKNFHRATCVDCNLCVNAIMQGKVLACYLDKKR